MPRKTQTDKKIEDDDPEHLQAMDETNEKWVTEWKRAAKAKPQTKTKK
jgi:hypothetical protein